MGGFDEFLFDEKIFNKEPGNTPTVTTQAITDFIGITAKGHGTVGVSPGSLLKIFSSNKNSSKPPIFTSS